MFLTLQNHGLEQQLSNSQQLHAQNTVPGQNSTYHSAGHSTSSGRAMLWVAMSVVHCPKGFTPEFLGSCNHAEGHAADPVGLRVSRTAEW